MRNLAICAPLTAHFLTRTAQIENLLPGSPNHSPADCLSPYPKLPDFGQCSVSGARIARLRIENLLAGLSNRSPELSLSQPKVARFWAVRGERRADCQTKLPDFGQCSVSGAQIARLRIEKETPLPGSPNHSPALPLSQSKVGLPDFRQRPGPFVYDTSEVLSYLQNCCKTDKVHSCHPCGPSPSMPHPTSRQGTQK